MADHVFPGNSFKQKEREDEPKYSPKQVAHGRRSEEPVQEESLSDKFLKSILDENPRDAAKNLVLESLVPNLKGAVYDYLNRWLGRTLGITRPLFGNSGTNSFRYINGSTYQYSGTNIHSYGPGASSSPTVNTTNNRPTSGNRYRFDLIHFDLKDEVGEVLEEVAATLKNYQVITVSQYFTICGIPTETVDSQYGWRSFDNVRVQLTDEGYVILPPNPEWLNGK